MSAGLLSPLTPAHLLDPVDRLVALLPRLQELVPTMAEVETGFGGDIMDPRIGTAFPHTVKKAAEALVEAWSTADAPAPKESQRP